MTVQTDDNTCTEHICKTKDEFMKKYENRFSILL